MRTPDTAPTFARRVPDIDYGILDDLVGYALRRAQLAIYADFEASLGPVGITPQRFSALAVIGANPGITQAKLGVVLCIARSGVVQLVRALVERDWIARDSHMGDARAWTLTLTTQGKTHLVLARRRVRAHDARIAAGLTAAETATLVTLLDRLGPPSGRARVRGK